ncbi:DUF484 family protein [Acidihalobacter prosperus]|uniref:Phytochrome sensor protein n=1 Tax=Acidihalobacter prosperus TaxID=160660 RepID=A0A1A6C1E7_9GAMM|nr:DUF484 family protein [Acidihalobacter prosperus]OBS08391.1 phytochrome sensor protein [Acidihalobacter prosperus]
MTRQTTSEPCQDPLSETEVADYLRAHPDFFARHLSLLEVLRLPHPTHGAVSLVERQTAVLRERNRQTERKLKELIQLARENEQLSANLHRLGLGLLQADSLDSVLATTREQLCDEFKADEVVVRLIGTEAAGAPYASPADDPGLAHFSGLFEHRRPICGRAERAQLDWLFGGEVADSLGSAVLIPLVDTQPLGVLALGSRDTARFHPSMGTLFLGYLGELVGAAVSNRLGRT